MLLIPLSLNRGYRGQVAHIYCTRILRGIIYLLLHADLVHHTHMPHPLSHRHPIYLCFVILTWLLQVSMREKLISGHEVCLKLENVSSLILSVRSRLITWHPWLVSLDSSSINHGFQGRGHQEWRIDNFGINLWCNNIPFVVSACRIISDAMGMRHFDNVVNRLLTLVNHPRLVQIVCLEHRLIKLLDTQLLYSLW